MEYITYEQYKEIGGTLDVTAFNRYSLRASLRIAQETQARIEKMNSIPDAVLHLCRDLIEYMHTNMGPEKALSSTSQSQGGVSESEVYIYKKPAEHETYISEMIYNYLASVTDGNGTSLIYGGCR